MTFSGHSEAALCISVSEKPYHSAIVRIPSSRRHTLGMELRYSVSSTVCAPVMSGPILIISSSGFIALNAPHSTPACRAMTRISSPFFAREPSFVLASSALFGSNGHASAVLPFQWYSRISWQDSAAHPESPFPLRRQNCGYL